MAVGPARGRSREVGRRGGSRRIDPRRNARPRRRRRVGGAVRPITSHARAAISGQADSAATVAGCAPAVDSAAVTVECAVTAVELVADPVVAALAAAEVAVAEAAAAADNPQPT